MPSLSTILSHFGLTERERRCCLSVRREDNERFIADTGWYRQLVRPNKTAAERAAIRAAMGPGHVMVNIITAERFTD